MKLSKKKVLLLIIPVLLIIDVIACVLLYFFEPVDYSEADLLQTSFSLELYDKFSYDKNPDFYIKQITANDIVSYDKDFRLKYIDDTIMIICNDSADSSDVNTLIADYNGKICGYISYLNLFQVEFSDYDLESLENICSEYEKEEFVLATCVDYFEETPPSEYDDSTDYILCDYNYSNRTIINYPENLNNNTDVVVGIFDSLVDNSNEFFNILNSDSYKREWLDDTQYAFSITHGSHVAGIACASSSSESPAIYKNGSIVSENAFNNSISYWIAAITDMIVNYDAKAINISMGYNTYISSSANLGCENAISYIENESYFFEKFLEKLIDADYEFLLCIAAGNDSSSTINKIPSHYFSYGDKKLLDKIDIFNLFTRKIKYADAQYSLPFTCIHNEKIKDHIIIVGSCNEDKEFSIFSDAGFSVDIVAPGENVYSFQLNSEYEFASGTSMAAPYVTGAAALIFAENTSLSAGEVKDIILNSATEYVSGYGLEYPLLNIGSALESAKN